jgi:hypothetical protein
MNEEKIIEEQIKKMSRGWQKIRRLPPQIWKKWKKHYRNRNRCTLGHVEGEYAKFEDERFEYLIMIDYHRRLHMFRRRKELLKRS